MAAEPESVIFLYDTAEERKNIVAKLHCYNTERSFGFLLV